jgi:uncharacterized protein YcbK (DUF882 family)
LSNAGEKGPVAGLRKVKVYWVDCPAVACKNTPFNVMIRGEFLANGVGNLFTKNFTRRTFLQTALAGALVLGGGGKSFAKIALAEKGSLSLFNTHTEERLAVTFRNADGTYDIDALNALNWIMRCHFTNQQTVMDVNTIEFLNLVDKRLGGGNEIHIISGFRSPSYNSLLSSNGRHVAKNSLHLVGKAIDIDMPGIDLRSVRRTAVALQLGGVGFYPGAGFVHIDSGKFRTW